MRDEARAVIIGGGVGGTSIAYHLAALGWQDVVLLEKGDIADGTTWHSAGLVGQLRPSKTLTEMNMHSVEVYRRLKEETGVDPGWKEVGSLRLISSQDRAEELDRLAGMATAFGLPLEIISTEEALELFPLFDPEGVRCAAYDPTDGYIDTDGLARALAEGARSRGVEICTGVRVTGFGIENGRMQEVITDQGNIRTEVVVNAAGMWAPQIGKLASVEVPLVPFQHQYVRMNTGGIGLHRVPHPPGPGRPGVLPSDGRRPRDGWLRPRPGTLVRRRGARRFRPGASLSRLGAVRTIVRQLQAACPSPTGR